MWSPQATTAYERECEALEGLKQALQATRKDADGRSIDAVTWERF